MYKLTQSNKFIGTTAVTTAVLWRQLYKRCLVSFYLINEFMPYPHNLILHCILHRQPNILYFAKLFLFQTLPRTKPLTWVALFLYALM